METNRSTVKVQRATTIPAAASDSTTAFEQKSGCSSVMSELYCFAKTFLKSTTTKIGV